MTERPTIHLVIASKGEYSDRIEWIVAAFQTEAEAIDCASQRNISTREEMARNIEYGRASHWIRMVEAEKVVGSMWGAFGKSDAAYQLQITPEQRQAIEREVVSRLGEIPAFDYENWADDHTVVSLPIGEIGHWDIC
jgi:hypothetical protein